ncbi:hypothetical protein BT69DRAFT_1307032 [Atractiella rhizophila]|nr:hypothetical protein BT69DRAFT_1307032 [Atractiella rhizophila]
MARLQALIPPTLSTRLFVLITIIETIVDITIEAILLNKFELRNVFAVSSADETIHENDQVLPVYLGIFVLAHFFQLFLAIEGIRNKNTIQIMGLCAFNAAFLAYSVIQVCALPSLYDVTGLVTVIPVMIAVAEVAFLALTWFIFREFGWQIYKKIGADRTLKKMYMWYQVFICLLKFDYFFFISFSLQLVLLVENLKDFERYLTIAAIPIILIGLFAGAIAVRRENKKLMIGFIASCALGAAYFAFKLFRIYHKRDTDYALVFKSLTVFAALSLILLLITVWIAYMCLMNFGKELKFHLTHHARSKAEKAYEADMKGAAHLPLGSISGSINNPSRLSID